MAVQRKHTKKRLSDVVVHNGVAYLSGQLATNFDGDIHTQTQETLANIDRLLADVGSDKSKIISATIYLKDIGKDFGARSRDVRPSTAGRNLRHRRSGLTEEPGSTTW